MTIYFQELQEPSSLIKRKKLTIFYYYIELKLIDIVYR